MKTLNKQSAAGGGPAGVVSEALALAYMYDVWTRITYILVALQYWLDKLLGTSTGY